MRLKGAVIRDPIIKVVTVGVIMAHSSKAEDLSVGTPKISLISIKVNLAVTFR